MTIHHVDVSLESIPQEYPSILSALDDARVISITKEEDGRFAIKEECDRYFSATLTRAQLLVLAEEIKAFADT